MGFLEDTPTGPSDNSFFEWGILPLQLYSFLSPLASNCPSSCLRVTLLPQESSWKVYSMTLGLLHSVAAVLSTRNTHTSLLCCCQTYCERPVQPCLLFLFLSLGLTVSLAVSLSATSKLIYNIMSHTSSHAPSPQRTHVYLSKLVCWSPISLSLKQEWNNLPRWRKNTKFKNVLHRNSFSSVFFFAQLLIRQGFAELNFIHILASFACIATTLLSMMSLLGSCCL